MDQIQIRHLELQVAIGVTARERAAPQPVSVDLTLHADLRAAGKSDRLADTVDYAALVARVRRASAKRSYCLIEALAEQLAGICLRAARVAAVDITVAKPGALPGVGVAVTLHRAR